MFAMQFCLSSKSICGLEGLRADGTGWVCGTIAPQILANFKAKPVPPNVLLQISRKVWKSGWGELVIQGFLMEHVLLTIWLNLGGQMPPCYFIAASPVILLLVPPDFRIFCRLWSSLSASCLLSWNLNLDLVQGMMQRPHLGQTFYKFAITKRRKCISILAFINLASCWNT